LHLSELAFQADYETVPRVAYQIEIKLIRFLEVLAHFQCVVIVPAAKILGSIKLIRFLEVLALFQCVVIVAAAKILEKYQHSFNVL